MQRNNWCLARVIVDMKMLAAKIVKAGLLLPLSGLVLLLAGGPATAASVGELAPDFEIATQDGAVFRLSDYRGRKPVYVVFWNSWCSYCIRRTPRYIKLQEQFSDKIEIIAINTTWSDSSFEQHHQIKYSTAFDAGESVTDQYGVRKVPTEFIVDVNGIIRYRDRVPEYLAAHLPDWLLPYIPSDHTAQLVCKK
jgi:peroxiredoxin